MDMGYCKLNMAIQALPPSPEWDMDDHLLWDGLNILGALFGAITTPA